MPLARYCKVTSEVYGMEDLGLMAVANRRRIWEACARIADLYLKALEATRADAQTFPRTVVE
ncbi:hypothetical protein BO82DRAFT_355319 [Aspergillus uvarum CBS 121591]|uniref:Uncharacterized protein n=1 Tax=Aspergillus uvarum CBS 121591 TaxID=1448315 RepID=A0A319CAH1_9EURO|nr:hypothetical protein BO82DRAFT_355319 [Aspergillus uvarum CBS 121591]PYH80607.1 hypothetical protein BO82DRAFT_355319 [Aspergillus uvarum CBS 121591]